MRREGNKILFDSAEQQQRFASSLEIGSSEFMNLIMGMIAKAVRKKSQAWMHVEEVLEGQLASDETLQYDFAREELIVVKRAIESYPGRADNRDEESAK